MTALEGKGVDTGGEKRSVREEKRREGMTAQSGRKFQTNRRRDS